MSAMYLAHEFQRPLKKEFVVQWDRRGTGKSYRRDISQTLTSEQLIADTVELTNLLRARFRQDKIYLVGHSWGTYFGRLVIARHPELYRAYVGIGQLARSGRPVTEIQDNYIRQCARRVGKPSRNSTKKAQTFGRSYCSGLVGRFIMRKSGKKRVGFLGSVKGSALPVFLSCQAQNHESFTVE